MLEEKHLVATLKDIVRKLNKEITSTGNEKDKLRIEYLKSEKLKQQVKDRRDKLVAENYKFFQSAHSNMYSN